MRGTAYVEAAVAAELRALATAPEGGRGIAAYRAAAALGGFVASGHLNIEAVTQLLLDTAMAAGLPEPEARSHIRRGLAKGAESPREVPDRGAVRTRVPLPLPPQAARRAASKTRPPGLELLWESSARVTEDEQVVAWLEGRGFDPGSVELWDLARALPATATLPRWARTRAGGSWTQSGHRLIVRCWNSEGQLAGLRARCVVPTAVPAKSLAPSGYRVRGLVLACPLAVQLLSGSVPDWWAPQEVVIAEGEPDWLVWAARQSDSREQGPAVLGVEAGAWTPDLAARIPSGSRVAVRTDHDAAGDRYAEAIFQTLGGRCALYRSTPGGSQ